MMHVSEELVDQNCGMLMGFLEVDCNYLHKPREWTYTKVVFVGLGSLELWLLQMFAPPMVTCAPAPPALLSQLVKIV